jgi:hypothetical protein
LNDCFERLGVEIKEDREKERQKEKVIGTDLKVRFLHMMPLNGGVTKEI